MLKNIVDMDPYQKGRDDVGTDEDTAYPKCVVKPSTLQRHTSIIYLYPPPCISSTS
jgi:hypothetical protein